jgi:AhpD family alkylhydroperoxidase
MGEQVRRSWPQDVDASANEAVDRLERYLRFSRLDPALFQLMKIRASQINGCAYRLDLHHGEAHAIGEDERRLDVPSAWREAP